MILNQYNKVTAALNQARQEIIEAKRPEYTEGNPDVLNNFKVIANELNVSPELAWYVYFRKHVASIGRYCADPIRQQAEPIQSRIADAINYLELLNAIVFENDDHSTPSNYNVDYGVDK